MTTVQDSLTDSDSRMRKSLEALGREFNSVRTGRASPALVEGLLVEYYGTGTPLNQLASISVPEPRVLMIQPWDSSALADVERSILKSDLGLVPNNDGTVIRINIPTPTEERRRELVRVVGQKVEEAHVAVRNIRRDTLGRLRDMEKDKSLSKDDGKRGPGPASTADRQVHRPDGRPPHREGGRGDGGLTQASSRQATPSRVVGAGAEAAGDAVPRHVAIIMDGNGRWASERTQPRSEGHRAGVENIRRILRRFVHHGVEYITLFAFSTENWDRPDDEVQVLMELLTEAIERETQPLHEEGVRIKHIGRLDRLSTALQNAIARSVELTKDNDVLTLSVAFNYGGRAEIVDAVRAIAAAGLASSEISEEVFQQYLYTRGLPDVDLIIRTAGEMRLSNFLLWQTHYAEYYSTPVFWPGFDEAEVTKALAAYGRRQRRYGGTASPETS